MDNGFKAKKAKKGHETISIEQWQTELTTHLAMEVLNVINKEEAEHGQEFGDVIRFSLIASLVSSIVYEVMTSVADGEEGGDLANATEAVHAQYQEVKQALQHAVAAGFEGAMHAFTGGIQEFHCEITPDPKAINTEPC